MTPDTFLLLAAVALLAWNALKLPALQRKAETLRQQTEELREKFKPAQLRVRKKLLRTLLLQNPAGKPAPTVTFQKLGKQARAVFASETVYSLAEDEGFGLSGTCEGNGDCGLCAVAVHAGAENLNPVSETEAAILKKLSHPAGARLSCQAHPAGDITVDFIDSK